MKVRDNDLGRKRIMRKLIMWQMLTVDGLFEGPDADIGWFAFDEDLGKYIDEVHHEVGTYIYGRATYRMMASYWPSAKGSFAAFMNNVEKIVFSATLDRADWNNTTLLKGDAVQEVTKLKHREGRDIFLVGSARLASTLIEHDLVDEYRFGINPLLLGSGTPFFKGGSNRLDLKLIHSKTLKSGVVILHYKRRRSQ